MRLDPNSGNLPLRKELVSVPGNPLGAAWHWGDNDEVGRLNLQTPARIKDALKEVVHGQVVPMSLPLDQPDPPTFGRSAFQHTIVRLAHHAFDDTYVVNPQSGSQWDGFRHFCHIPSGLFYNKTRPEDIQGDHSSSKCGMQAWADRGIAGRTILLDFGSYAEAEGLNPVFYDNYKISYATLMSVAKAQGIDLRPASVGGDIKIGDILLVRSGFLKHSLQMDQGTRSKQHLQPSIFGPRDGQRYIGLEQSEEMLDFLHDSYFSAVAGDQPAFEAWPSEKGYYLHEYLLALWGCPLGELWDLENLAAKCKANKKWIFFISSAPNYVKGGVGSFANAVAIL